MTLPHPVAALLNARRLEQIPADQLSAELRLARAEEKLDAARKIAAIDVEVAYVTAYDAMRIAVTAHMLALGYRVRAISAAHEAVGIYAETMITSQAPTSTSAFGADATRLSTTTSPSAARTSRLESRTLLRSSKPSA